MERRLQSGSSEMSSLFQSLPNHHLSSTLTTRAATLFFLSFRLKNHFTLKICTSKKDGRTIPQAENEMAVSNLFKSLENGMEHPGIRNLRLLVDHFEVTSSGSTHDCLLYPPLGMSFTEFRNRLPDRVFPKLLFQRSTQLISLGVDLLHQAGIVHTGMYEI